MTDSPSGLLLLDKPSGVTSFDCVHEVRRKLGIQRVGHCGTLDPLARGLLMILVGPAARAQDSFLGLEKEYWFRGEFGIKTSTADLEGTVVEKRSCAHVTQDSLKAVLDTFVGETQQTPPAHSALKYKGKPNYYYARRNISVPRIPRAITIASLSLLSFTYPYWEARVVCSRGTYVRTLAEDIAERLGACATLVELIRDRVGPYKKDQALSWQELRVMEAESILPLLLPASKEEALAYV